LVLGCCVAVVAALAPVAWFVGRRAGEKRRAREVIAAQPPGFWGELHFPVIPGGALVVGIPADASARALLREASEDLETVLGDKVDTLMPGGARNETRARVWCVPVRIINMSATAQHVRQSFTLILRRDGTTEYALETAPRQVLPLLGESGFKHQALLEAASRLAPALATTDWVVVFMVPADIPRDMGRIQAVDCRVDPYGFGLEWKD